MPRKDVSAALGCGITAVVGIPWVIGILWIIGQGVRTVSGG